MVVLVDGLSGLRNKAVQILRLREGAGLLFWLGPVAVAVASDRNLCLGEATHLSELFRLLGEPERLVPVHWQLRLPRAAWGYGFGWGGGLSVVVEEDQTGARGRPWPSCCLPGSFERLERAAVGSGPQGRCGLTS
ncbi:MAG: hypothetical protein NZ869_06975 [Thermoanaerobaculum sp.]|nr:hypothetical protein [Thermoanaerobaculum sp.]MDW7966776.1 hypothetical protein [Thermoanaerobaculum sp.]